MRREEREIKISDGNGSFVKVTIEHNYTGEWMKEVIDYLFDSNAERLNDIVRGDRHHQLLQLESYINGTETKRNLHKDNIKHLEELPF
jgi:hypothetical protein